MNETNLNWDDFRLFLAVAREGGLAAAANITGKSAPTLGRRMLALEQRLGKELFERLPSGYVLTEQGQHLLAHVLLLEEKIQPVMSDASNMKRVKISAGTWVTQLLCEKAAALVGDIPVQLQFISADHLLDIGHREAVIGIRNKQPNQVTLAGRAIKPVRFAIYAVDESITLWARVIGSTPSAQWVKNCINNDRYIEITNPKNALDLAVNGIARAVLPTFIGNRTAGLKQISNAIPELEHTQWLVTHHEARHTPEVRQVIDQVYEILKSIDS